MIHRYHGTNEAMIQLGHHKPVYTEKSWESLQVPLAGLHQVFYFFPENQGMKKPKVS